VTDLRSRGRGFESPPPTAAAVCQLQLSVPSLRDWSISTSESWGVNGHTTRCTSPVSVVLRLRLVSSWGLRETEISAALWTQETREGLYMASSRYREAVKLAYSDSKLAFIENYNIMTCGSITVGL